MKLSLSFLVLVAVIQLGSSNVISKRGTQEQLLSDANGVQNGSDVIMVKPGPLDVILDRDELVFEVRSLECNGDFLVFYESDPSGFQNVLDSCTPPPTTTIGQLNQTSSGEYGHASASTAESGSFFADNWWIFLILGIILNAIGILIGIGVGVYCYLRRKKNAQKPVPIRRRKLQGSKSPVVLQASTEKQNGRTESAVRPDSLFQQSSILSHRSLLYSKKEEAEKEKSMPLSSLKQQLPHQQQRHLDNMIERHLVKMDMYLQQPMNLEASLMIIGGFFQSLVLSLSPLVLELASAVIFDVKRNLKSLSQLVDENFKGVNLLLFYSHQLKHNKEKHRKCCATRFTFSTDGEIEKIRAEECGFMMNELTADINGETPKLTVIAVRRQHNTRVFNLILGKKLHNRMLLLEHVSLAQQNPILLWFHIVHYKILQSQPFSQPFSLHLAMLISHHISSRTLLMPSVICMKLLILLFPFHILFEVQSSPTNLCCTAKRKNRKKKHQQNQKKVIYSLICSFFLCM